MASAEEQYWRKKLPPGFQQCMENLGRSIICNKPKNILEHAAWYLEKKLHERNAALENLPKVSYLQKLKQKRCGNKPLIRKLSSISKDDVGEELIETNITAASAHTFPMTKSSTKHGKTKSVEEFISHTLQRTTSGKSGVDTPVETTNTTAEATGENSDSMGQEDVHASHEHTVLVETDKHSESEQHSIESTTSGENEEALGNSREKLQRKSKAEAPENQEAANQHHSENKVVDGEALVVKEECDSESAAVVADDHGNQGDHKQAVETCTDTKMDASEKHGKSEVERVEETANNENGKEITEQQPEEKQVQETDGAVPECSKETSNDLEQHTKEAKQYMEEDVASATNETAKETEEESKQQAEESDTMKEKQAETVTAKETEDESKQQAEESDGIKEKQAETVTVKETKDELQQQSEESDAIKENQADKETEDASQQQAEESDAIKENQAETVPPADKETTDKTSDSFTATTGNSETPKENDKQEGASGSNATDEKREQKSRDTLVGADNSKENTDDSKQHTEESTEHTKELETESTVNKQAKQTSESKEQAGGSDMHTEEPMELTMADNTQERYIVTEDSKETDKEADDNAELLGVTENTLGEITSEENDQTENVPSKEDKTELGNNATVEDSRESANDPQHVEVSTKDMDGQETDSTKEELITQTNDESIQQAGESEGDELKQTHDSDNTDIGSGTEKPETATETAGNTGTMEGNETELSEKAEETSKQLEEAREITFKEGEIEERSGSPEKGVIPGGAVETPVESKGETDPNTAESAETETPEKNLTG